MPLFRTTLHCRSLKTASVIFLTLGCIACYAWTKTETNSQSPRSEVGQDADDQQVVEDGETWGGLFDRFCLECHNSADRAGELSLERMANLPTIGEQDQWEAILKKLTARQMPPADADRPSEAEYERIVSGLTSQLDDLAEAHPNPGRTPSLRRLTRIEYRNAIRDLLSLDIDVESLLPSDSAGHGFDNVNVSDLSPTLLERYVAAAEKISHLALGRQAEVRGDTFRSRPDRTQEEHVPGLPLGTRGGMLLSYTFPADGEYEVQVRLTRDRDEHVEGLRARHEMDILVDDELVERFVIRPPSSPKEHASADQHLQVRFKATAGSHRVGVAFLKKPTAVLETKRQPLEAHFNRHRHPRQSPAVFEVSIAGPFGTAEPSATPIRKILLAKRPKDDQDEAQVVRETLSRLLRRAYRRPITDADLEVPLRFYHEGRANGDFETGIESALSAILVNPNFLFRVESDPSELETGEAYSITDLELASRLSFFLWSSIPDDELLDLAERGELSKPDVLEQQTRRMLRDPRAHSLVENFAAQWLYLRNLDTITPNLRRFPDFDDNLRQAFRRETELLFESVLREDRSVLDLLRTDETFVDERLAKHYGIPHVYGSRFRRVSLDSNTPRGGLLRHGSILTVTSYATRTSPVIRGHWILENLVGTPPPPPPANVPALKESVVSSSLPVRERLRQHREDETCASCHRLMDPPGFALENYDAVGRWRVLEAGRPIDATGGMPDGRQLVGVAGLEQALLSRPELFVGTLTEKLMIFALGRGIEAADRPFVRQVVRSAAENDYRFSELIVALVQSPAFRMRKTE